MPGETLRAFRLQSDWLRALRVEQRLPEGAEVVFTGCGTSFHAAQTGGHAVQALKAVLGAIAALRGEETTWLAAALRELGCETTLVQAVHPVVHIVRFQRARAAYR